MQFSQTIQFSISMPLVLFNPEIGPCQVIPQRARVDLEAMAIKGYSAFPKAPELLELHHQIVLCHIQDTRCGGGHIPLQRSIRCILQPQPTRQSTFWTELSSLVFSSIHLLRLQFLIIWIYVTSGITIVCKVVSFTPERKYTIIVRQHKFNVFMVCLVRYNQELSILHFDKME